METCCGDQYDQARRAQNAFHRIFTDHQERTGHGLGTNRARIRAIRHGSASGGHPFSSQSDSRAAPATVKKKRQLFPGLLLMSPNWLVLPPRTTPTPGAGMSTGFPVDSVGDKSHFQTAFAYLLGSTHLRPSNVPAEPFSTSVFKVPI